MAPFSHLISKYGSDLAVLWIDSHPDIGTGQSAYAGCHAMVSALTGHGDPELLHILPATTTADRVALVGLHDWTDPSLPAIARDWDCRCSPRRHALEQHTTTRLAARHRRHEGGDPLRRRHDRRRRDPVGIGCRLGGLTSAEVHRLVADIDGSVDVVGLTIAEFIPRRVMHLQRGSSRGFR
jgi:arginase